MVHSVLLSGLERRRKWPDEDRRRILEEAFSPGAKVTEVARRWEVSTGLIYTWRRSDPASQQGPAFARAVVSGAQGAPEKARAAVVVADGVRVRISHTAPEAVIRATLRSLR